MGWTLNIVLKAALLACGMVFVYQWQGGTWPPTPAKLYWTAVTAALFGFLVRPMFCRRSVPDHIPDDILTAFDAGGLSFAPRFEADGTAARLKVYFQNCHARPCSVDIHLAAPPGHGSTPDVLLRLDVPGAASGVAHVRVPKGSGRPRSTFHFKVYAVARYPEGRGRALRPTRGTLVPPPALAGFLNGFGSSNEIPLRLPDALPVDCETPTRVEIVSVEDRGFPVLPR